LGHGVKYFCFARTADCMGSQWHILHLMCLQYYLDEPPVSNWCARLCIPIVYAVHQRRSNCCDSGRFSLACCFWSGSATRYPRWLQVATEAGGVFSTKLAYKSFTSFVVFQPWRCID
jgi:hypothetical protein